jgi:hypothetical protein
MKTASLLYFLAGGHEPPAYALENGRLARRGPVTGPGGVVGTLATPCAAPLVEYAPERQCWTRIAEGESREDGKTGSPADELNSEDGKTGSGADGRALWIGVDTVTPAGPEDLARAEMRPGHPVTLAGMVWTIPPARMFAGGTGLPRRRAFGPDGALVWAVEAAWRELAELAEKFWSARAGMDVAIAEDELDRACGLALSVNYRIALPEAVAMGLLTDNGVRAIVDALLDWPVVVQLMDAQKKTGDTPGN